MGHLPASGAILRRHSPLGRRTDDEGRAVFLRIPGSVQLAGVDVHGHGRCLGGISYSSLPTCRQRGLFHGVKLLGPPRHGLQFLIPFFAVVSQRVPRGGPTARHRFLVGLGIVAGSRDAVRRISGRGPDDAPTPRTIRCPAARDLVTTTGDPNRRPMPNGDRDREWRRGPRTTRASGIAPLRMGGRLITTDPTRSARFAAARRRPGLRPASSARRPDPVDS